MHGFCDSSNRGDAINTAKLFDVVGKMRLNDVAAHRKKVMPKIGLGKRIAAQLELALGALSGALARSPAVQDKLNGWLRTFAAETIVAKRALIVGLVRRVIRSWDAQTLSHKFELHVGRDLQYIRINGTLVGGLVGLLLHGLGLLF